MKGLLISIFFCFPLSLFGQSNVDDIEFVVLYRDTIYTEDWEGELTLLINEKRYGIVKYKSEIVHKMSMVNKPAELHKENKSLDVIITNSSQELLNLLPKGIYNFFSKACFD